MLTFKSFSSSSYPYAYRNVLLIQERKNVCEKMGSNKNSTTRVIILTFGWLLTIVIFIRVCCCFEFIKQYRHLPSDASYWCAYIKERITTKRTSVEELYTVIDYKMKHSAKSIVFFVVSFVIRGDKAQLCNRVHMLTFIERFSWSVSIRIILFYRVWHSSSIVWNSKTLSYGIVKRRRWRFFIVYSFRWLKI